MPPRRPPQSVAPRTAPASRSLGRALLWPAAAVGLGILMVHHSFDDSAADAKPQPRPAAVATATPEFDTPDYATTEFDTPDFDTPGLGPSGIGTPSAAPALRRSTPKRLSIPEIAVDAPFTPLSLGASGRLNAPPATNTNLVGWFRSGATPGERGSAIVAGHLDTKTGPAVFARLDRLGPGSTVDITREDGTVARFTVDSVETFSKARFPDDRVYGDTASAQLRLITCGGAYDKKAKDYVDNVVVFAHLASSRPAA
ncbi:class F sortase [Streptomyces sp. 8N706]|uniref:class F sortase n=1 Tax=Streptomyces sp. 8N706 TaxID=3457416 RepID=UPI003FCEFAD3